MKRLRFVF